MKYSLHRKDNRYGCKDIDHLVEQRSDLSGFAITKEFEPSYEWDAENGRFTDIQTTKDGVPVWSGEALIGQGWAGDVQPIQLRVVSNRKPSLRVDPAKIAMLFANADTANNVRTTNVPAPTTAGMSQPKHEAR